MSVVSRDVHKCWLCNSEAVLVDMEDELTGAKRYRVLCTSPEFCGLATRSYATVEGALEAWENQKGYAERVKQERRDRA